MPQALTFTRDLYLPRDLVFEAWTQAEHVGQWYAPDGCPVTSVVVEPRERGRFELAWTDPAGVPVREAGEFERFSRPEGFVCRMNMPAAAQPVSSCLRLTLDDAVDACRVELRVEDVPAPEAAAVRELWEARLDRLEAYFAAI